MARLLRLPLGLLLLLVAAVAGAAELRVDFLDVGQGDAALITSPTGKTVLIDGGPPEAATRLMARLASLGHPIGHPIDLVVLTHRHADHLGGLVRLLRDGPGARQIIDSQFPHPSPLYQRLVDELAARRVTVRDAIAGRTVDLGGGATLTLLGPPSPPIAGSRSDVNANSVIARLDFRNASVLFCADAEAETERWLIASGRPLAARVVKVAHHGSRYSSTAAFVRAVHPEAAVVSAGAHNDYGHPHEEALARWRAAGARIYRTDRDGEVTLRSDGEKLTFEGHPTAPSAAGAAPLGRAPRNRHPGVTSKTLQMRQKDPITPTMPDPHGYRASRRSTVFHRASCPGAMSIVERNRIGFPTRADALASGRRPAEDCRP